MEQHHDEDNDEDDEYDEEEEGPRYLESDFKFEDFVKRLPHPKVVRACGLALRQFETNSVNTNHCIAKLLHRIASDCKMYVMVFQVSIFRTFQRIFAAKDLPQHKELVKFATYIIRQFFKVAEINKKVFMEALFWKSTKEAYDIEQGYGSYHEKSAASARAWSEQEEDELRRLFMEHQQNQVEEDVVDWIVNNLIDNTRTRRGVLKKLKEMCLLTEYKGRKKSGVRAKIPQSWGAEEETQLQELYEQFKDAADPLGCILPRLEISRPKNRVIEKMLVMGLIQDKKELRKKRVMTGKLGGRKSRGQPRYNEDSASSSDDDNYQDDIAQSASSASNAVPQRPAKKNSATSRKKPTKKKVKNGHVAVPRSQLVKLLLKNMESGLEEALQWLKESMSDAIEDFEDGNNEGIPLVPIMDYAEAAMDNIEFQQTLKAFGICEPFDEQEAYWRIPGHLTVDILNTYCNLIQEAVDKTLTEEIIGVNEDGEADDTTAGASSSAMPSRNDESSDDEDVFERLRKTTNQKASSSKTLEERSVNDVLSEAVDGGVQDKENVHNEVEIGNPEEMETSFQKRASRKLIDSDDDSMDVDNNVLQVEANTSFGKKKGRNVIESDSEEEADKENSGNSREVDSKRVRSISDSDTEKPATKRSRVIESDED